MSDKLFRSLCLKPSLVLKTLKAKDCITSLYRLPHCLTVLGVKRFLLISRWILSYSKFWPLSLTFPPCLWAVWLMFLWTPYKYLGAAVRPSKVSIFLSLSAQGECPQLELTPVCHCLMLSKRSETGPLSPVSQGWGEVLITAMDLLAVLLLVHPKMFLHSCSCISLQPGHCWLTPTLPSTSTCKFFSAELIQSCSTPANPVPASINSGILCS